MHCPFHHDIGWKSNANLLTRSRQLPRRGIITIMVMFTTVDLNNCFHSHRKVDGATRRRRQISDNGIGNRTVDMLWGNPSVCMCNSPVLFRKILRERRINRLISNDWIVVENGNLNRWIIVSVMVLTTKVTDSKSVALIWCSNWRLYWKNYLRCLMDLHSMNPIQTLTFYDEKVGLKATRCQPRIL